MRNSPWNWKRLASACLAGILSAGLALSGLLNEPDKTLSDKLCQRPRAVGDEIVLLNIDQRALEDLGPFQSWGRDVMAQVLEALNADPNQKPAVIGVDVIFAGETEQEADAWLAEAAAACGNVVMATTGDFGAQLKTEENGSFYMDPYVLLAYDEPYAALKEVTKQGHVNAMYDEDGILRHAIWQIDLPDGRTVPSFHQQIYRQWAAFAGLDPEITPPMDARHRWYVPFQAMPGDYSDNFSIADLLDGSLSPSLYADKIVLIGPYAAGLLDNYITAMDHAQSMYGVEYQANAIGALLAGDFPREMPELPQAVFLGLLCFFCQLWMFNRKPLPVTLLWLFVALGWGGVALIAWASGYVLQVLYVPLSITALYAVAIARNYLHILMEKRHITSTFQRYVAPEIVTELLKGGPDALQLGGRLTEIAVLFVDIRGFTPLSEQLSPEQVVEVLNQCLTMVSSCILDNAGTLDKFVGDAAMAFWGAPLPQEDSVYKAVKTALDMVAKANTLSTELEALCGQPVAFGVGVHCGPAVVGNIGAPSRMDYTAIGDTVNTAARLESMARGGQVFVSRAVADVLAGRARFTSLGDTIPLKGKTAGFEILTVDGLLAQEEGQAL